MSSPSLPQASNPAVNLPATPISVAAEKKPASGQVVTTKVHLSGEVTDGSKAKQVTKKTTVETISKTGGENKHNYQESTPIVTNYPATKHTIIPVTAPPAKKTAEGMTPQPSTSGPAGVTLSHHIGPGNVLQPPLSVIPSGAKITGIATTQVSRGSHITAVRPGLPTATIMRSTNLAGHQPLPGGETVLSQVYMYPQHVQVGQSATGPSHIQAKLLAPSTVMTAGLRLGTPPQGVSTSMTDHNRNLGQVISGAPRGTYQAVPVTAGSMPPAALGQTVLAADNKSHIPTQVQPITLQVKADGSSHATYQSVVAPSTTLKHDAPAGGIVTSQQPQQMGQNQRQDGNPPLKVEVRMVICSDNTADKVKNEQFRVEQVMSRPDAKEVRLEMRPELKGGVNQGGVTQLEQGSGKIVKTEVTDSKKSVKDRLVDPKERSNAKENRKTDVTIPKGEREVEVQRVYRPEKKMSLKTEIRHDGLRPGDPPAWPGGTLQHAATTRHSFMQAPPQKTRMTVSPSAVVPSAKPHVRAHTVNSAPPATTMSTSTAAAILVSASAAPASVRQQVPNTIPASNSIVSSASIPVAKVYPRQQQQTLPPQSQQMQHATTTRVMTNSVRLSLPSTSGTDTTSAPTSFQPLQSSVRGPIPLPTIQTLPSVTGQDNRQHRPQSTVISTQQPFHHPHGRYNFSGELFGYPTMLQSYPGHPYGPIQGTSLRGAQDGHARYPFVTTSASLPTVGHPHGPPGGPVRYGGLMMLDPISMSLSPGVTTASDGHSGESPHGAGTINQVGSNSTSDSPTAVANSGASPRPSILRKRVSESSALRKHPISALNSSHHSRPNSPASKLDSMRQPTASASPKPNFKRGLNFTKVESDSLPNSQQSVESNASETSTDTAPSSVGSVKIKPDPDAQPSEVAQNSNSNDALVVPSSQLSEEGTPSPRKKQRKQVLKVATEHPDIPQDPSTDEEVEKIPRVSYKALKKQRKAIKAEHMKVVQYVKRTCPRLMDAYRSTCSWKPALNHFERYSDVKQKEEKKASIHEIANQRGIIKKTEGWKIKHISGQFEDLTSLEQEIHDEIEDMKRGLATLQKREEDGETATVYELVQGSLQRSKYVIDNLGEARTIVMKLLEHKPKVSTILKKHANKRHAKKKNTSP
ncbi:hypothetical protein HOLleu_27278 [Holothuria leucospilota]|uniref:Histone deacetylase complex subunit SAP130 C-terminal domain-containing protein n=1 Tax=Holothuria leucospilota TaxID=206669 RepID=A0A9Q1BQ76_HOLLE|nr:hypothetical protein HOLleu_27278 [Holothuria leucospilota]